MLKKKDIDDWLKNKCVYKKFYESCKNLGRTIGEHPMRYDENLITNAFPWHLSPDGADFWNNLDYAYRGWYKKQIKKINKKQ